MSEAKIIGSPDGHLFDGKTPEELEALLNTITEDGDIPLEPEPSVEVPVEPEPEAPVEPEATPEPEEPEPEIDLAASEREGERIARENMEAKMALQEAHNSRLAGEIGYLREQLKIQRTASEPYEPQTQAEVDRLSLLEQRLAQAEARTVMNEVSQAVASAMGALEGPWVQELAEHITAIAPKYADQLKLAQETTDPELARQIATGVGMAVHAEARQMEWAKRHEGMLAKKTAASADMAKAKKAQAPSGSGGVPPPPPKTKTPADMNVGELDAWLRENVR